MLCKAGEASTKASLCCLVASEASLELRFQAATLAKVVTTKKVAWEV